MTKKPAGAGKSSMDLVDWPQTEPLLKVAPASEFLDLACGFGRYSLALAEIVGPRGRIYAVDLWTEGLDQLREQAEKQGIGQIKTVHADISKELPIADGMVDNSLLATALHDVPAADRGAVFRQVHRVLKPGGLFNLIEFRKDLDGPPGPPAAVRLSAEELECLAVPAGFAKILAAEIGPCVYLVQFVKNP